MHMAFLGEESQWAAEASECAADQDAFWDYHDKLFVSHAGENQGAFSKDKLKGFAAELGLDTAAFNSCLDSDKYTEQVKAETAAANSLGVQSTPSFYINNWLVLGALPLEEFESYFDKARQGLNPPPTPTPLPAGAQFYGADPNRLGFTFDGSPTLGNSDARLVMVTFEDFKSTASAQNATDVEPTLKTKYIDAGKMRLMVKSFADTAPRAAVAAVCAGRQGKFWEFRTLLYQKQAEWTEGDDAAMTGYAKSLGLDDTAFGQCMKDDQAQIQVDTALEFGQKQVGVPSTPSFLLLKLDEAGQIGDVKGFPGLQSLDQLESAIDDILTALTIVVTPPAPIAADTLANLPVGVTAEGYFYRGDPNATVRLNDFSDFQ